MAATSGSGEITEKVTYWSISTELTSLSQGWLNRFAQSCTRLKAIMWSQIKLKWTMALTSGSGDIIKKITQLNLN